MLADDRHPTTTAVRAGSRWRLASHPSLPARSALLATRQPS
ncbi:hypothetical protein QQG74_14285 [Micromonospora sp. FIMYZ51]